MKFNQLIKKHLINILFVLAIAILISLSVVVYYGKHGFPPKFNHPEAKMYLSPLEQSLAEAIDKKSYYKIKKTLEKDKSFITKSYSGEKYYSLLHYAVDNYDAKAVELLLNYGYNPNVQDSQGDTPLIESLNTPTHHFIGKYYPDDPAIMVKAFLKHGASPDICNDKLQSPLMYAAKSYLVLLDDSYTILKLLIEIGNCNINLLDADGHSVAYYFLNDLYGIKAAHYLIVERKADLTNDPELCSSLRKHVYKLDSEEYKLKMEIVNEFKNQGIDYFTEPVPENILNSIKKEFPDSWEDYLKVY